MNYILSPQNEMLIACNLIRSDCRLTSRLLLDVPATLGQPKDMAFVRELSYFQMRIGSQKCIISKSHS